MGKKIIRPFVATKDPMVRDILQRMSERSDEGLTKYKVDMEMANKLDVFLTSMIVLVA